MKRLLFSIFSLFILSTSYAQSDSTRIILGNERIDEYIYQLSGRRVGVLTNHTGMVGNTHIVDTLISLGVNVTAIFVPEHGFRGDKSDGEAIPSSIDANTGVEIISLYGACRIPEQNDILKTDIIVVDIQDVGLRYYTYLSTLYNMMQVCADVDVEMLILDKPNPNGMYVDGPILDLELKSFVGVIPIPTVHGMTLGELARMINGKRWLEDRVRCELNVIPCLNYSRSMRYELPIPPSPNLPNIRAIYLYPSLCLFEGTPVSIGRGTDSPFQTFGHPDLEGDFEFTPISCGSSKYPPQEGKLCRGVNLQHEPTNDELIESGIDLSYLIECYNSLGGGEEFFLPIFNKLAGVYYIKDMIIEGFEAEEIEAKWEKDVKSFKRLRKKYLIYEE